MSDNKTLSLNKNDKPELVAEGPKEAKREYVRVAAGHMVHLLTNESITTTPKKMDMDFWLQAQIDAGKVLIGEAD